MTVPDYASNPNAVLADNVKWRFNHTPNYSRARKLFNEGASSLFTRPPLIPQRSS